MFKGTFIIAGIVISLVLLSGSRHEAFPCGCGSNPSPPSPTGYTVPLPVMVPPMPEFERKWLAQEVIESFDKTEFTLKGQRPDKEAVSPLISKAEDAVSFTLPAYGKDAGLAIQTFQSRNKLRSAQKRFLNLNKKGQLHTWSFVKDNVLLVLTGTVPEHLARQYEKALYSMKK